MPESTTEAELAELAITVYIEELATDKRVLYVGDPQSRGPDRLAKVARSVELVSPRARARGTRRGSRVQARRWPDAEDHARWDVVVVPDLDAAGLSEEKQIDKVGAWLADGGVLVAGTAGTERGLSYEGLFDLLQVNFDSVRMIGQAPFRGFSLVDFAPPGDLAVTFDGSLLEGAGEQAQRFLALCGDQDVVLDAYAVVQIPSSAPEARRPARERVDPAGEDAARRGRVSELNERVRDQQDALDAANVHAEDLEREVAALRTSLGSARTDLSSTSRRVQDATRAQRSVEAARGALVDKLKEERTERAALETKLKKQALKKPVASPAGASDAEYARFEVQLHESGRQLTEVRDELERRAVLVRDLIEELAERPVGPAAPAAVEPASVEPAAVEPAAVEPTAVEPTAVEPTAVEPTAAEGSDGPEEGSPGLMSTIGWSAEEMLAALRRQVSESAERAVAAEADKTSLEFRLDEVRGELAISEMGREQDIEELRRLEAALRGTVRGLNARLAEVTELYQQAQAQLVLSEDDEETASEHGLDLERELAETREQLEIQLSRASAQRAAAEQAATVPPIDGPEQSARFAAREGELMDALAKCRDQAAELTNEARRSAAEAETAQRSIAEVDERVAGLRRGYETRIAEIVSELDTIGGDTERAWVQNGELKAKIDAMERADAGQRGELTGTKLRLADREEAVAALVAQAAQAPETETTSAPSTEDLEALRGELAQVRGEAEALRAELSVAARSSSESAQPDGSVVEARDAMIARLQGELAQAQDRYRTLEGDLSRSLATLDRHRERVESARVEGVVEAEQSVRELDELTSRLKESETERRSAHEALAAAKEILHDLVEGLPEVGSDDSDAGIGDLRSLRERVGRLDAQAADREVIMRSLTAQLQERDDRIRGLERFDPSDEQDPQALRARTLELEERAMRLAEELENERRARRRLEEG